MPWTYYQSTGVLERGNVKYTGSTAGYSGHGPGKNNPSMQQVPNTGPIPRGTWRIHHPQNSTSVGNYAMPLTPMPGTVTFGRSAFFIHGDSTAHPGEASHGCIVIGPQQRHAIWGSGDHFVNVVQ